MGRIVAKSDRRDLENILTGHRGPIIDEEKVPEEQSLKDMEKEYIIGTLQRTHWHLGKNCDLLGISRPTLRQKLKTYGLARDLKAS